MPDRDAATAAAEGTDPDFESLWAAFWEVWHVDESLVTTHPTTKEAARYWWDSALANAARPAPVAAVEGEAIALLREVQWAPDGECPMCGWTSGHRRACRLGNCLARADAPREGTTLAYAAEDGECICCRTCHADAREAARGEGE